MRVLEELLRDTVEKFNRKAAEDQNLSKELAGIRKLIQVETTDGDTYHFTLENSRIGAVEKGSAENPDIRVIADTETYTRLATGELRAMKAYATRKLQVKGSIEDLLRLRKLF